MALLRHAFPRPSTLVAYFVALIIAGVSLLACGATPSESKYCSSLGSLRDELAHMAQTVDTMSTVGSSDLRDAFETGVEALVSLGQQAPKDLVAEYEQLLGAYRVIEMELSASNWLSSDYLASSHSAKQLALLTSEDTNIAVEVITTDAANHCKLDLSFSAESTDTVVTLPQPPTPDDSTLDRPVSLEEGDSSTIAMGMFVAERYSLAITNPQALCVGDKFMLMPEQGDLDEKGLDELYRSLLTDCGVVLPQS